jgi:hypothetical protein
MEQRREPRFEIDQPVAVTLLGGREIPLRARVKNASGRGVALEVDAPVSPGTALKIVLDDAVVLGEAVYCRKSGSSHLIGVELDQMLCGLAELGRKLQEFAVDESERQLPYPVYNRRGEDRQQT